LTKIVLSIINNIGDFMYKATRKLIQARQQLSKYVIETVQVEKIGGGKANACFDNAFDQIDRSKGITIVSGWIVGSYDKYKNSTEIVQHFWNADRQGRYFDTTPLIRDDVEYVVDTDICHYGQEHYEEIDSCVAASLLFKDDRFLAVDLEDGQLNFRNIKKLSMDELFDIA
jgi:hypothetical protein